MKMYTKKNITEYSKNCNYIINNSHSSRIKDSTIITFNNKGIAYVDRVPIRRSLHIGINYTDTEYKLRGCINDANNISKLIKVLGILTINV